MKKFFVLTFFITLFLNNGISQPGWQQQSITLGNYLLTSVFPVSQNICFASAEYLTTFENYFTLYKTTNSGNNWSQIANSSGWFLKNLKFTDSLNGFAVGGLNRLYMTENQFGKVVLKTTNAGNNWTIVYQLISIPGTEMEFTDLYFINNNTGWISSRDGSIIKTTNSGLNFTNYYTTPNFKKSSISFVGPLYGWTAGDSGRIAYTINGGINWTTINSLSNSHLKSISFVNLITGYVCGNNGILLKTTDGGINWNALNTGVTSNLNSIFFLNADTGWVAGNNVILMTKNGGINWSSQYNENSSLNCIRFFNQNMGWACGGNKMLYTISGGVTDINNISSETPNGYNLLQNYPNPFNPETKIRFSIPKDDYVNLLVTDVLSRVVLKLVDKHLSSGSYVVTFNANNIPAGVYFYKLITPTFTQSRKMILLK